MFDAIWYTPAHRSKVWALLNHIPDAEKTARRLRHGVQMWRGQKLPKLDGGYNGMKGRCIIAKFLGSTVLECGRLPSMLALSEIEPGLMVGTWRDDPRKFPEVIEAARIEGLAEALVVKEADAQPARVQASRTEQVIDDMRRYMRLVERFTGCKNLIDASDEEFDDIIRAGQLAGLPIPSLDAWLENHGTMESLPPRKPFALSDGSDLEETHDRARAADVAGVQA